MEGSADADQRHRIIITMMNLEEKTDTRMIVSWCATHNDVEVKEARGECTWKCGERRHFRINCWLRPSSLSQVLTNSGSSLIYFDIPSLTGLQ